MLVYRESKHGLLYGSKAVRYKTSEKEERPEMTTKYIYSVEGCPRCKSLRDKYRESNIAFIERNADRLSLDPRIFDVVDKEAYTQLLRNNMTYPVEIDSVLSF